MDPRLQPDGTSAPSLGSLTRSPQPYSLPSLVLSHPADCLVSHRSSQRHRRACSHSPCPSRSPSSPSSVPAPIPDLSPDLSRSPASNESGTEADDEHFLRGLPAPRPRLNKGVRGHEGTGLPIPGLISASGSDAVMSGPSSPFPYLASLDIALNIARTVSAPADAGPTARRVQMLFRRTTEAALLAALAAIVVTNPDVRPLLVHWSAGLCLHVAIVGGVCAIRIASIAVSASTSFATVQSLGLPTGVSLTLGRFRPSFDPAPLLYPPVITILVSVLVAVGLPYVMLHSLVLAICTIPAALLPTGLYPFSSADHSGFNPVHWLLSCLPLPLYPDNADEVGTAVLLYPLHQYLCAILRHLVSTSILPAELQLLSVGLVSLLLRASSPQAHLLNGLLWLVCLCTTALSSQVIMSAVNLARVPNWRFRREVVPIATEKHASGSVLSLIGAVMSTFSHSSVAATILSVLRPTRRRRARPDGISKLLDDSLADDSQDSSDQPEENTDHTPLSCSRPSDRKTRRASTTPSGRRRRAVSTALRPFIKLTRNQARGRRWLYAAYVYLAGLATYFFLRVYLSRFALGGYDPMLWALGFLFGDLAWFRLEVERAGLDGLIPLPMPASASTSASTENGHGWLQRVRLEQLGAANARLALAGYWIVVIAVGFSLVFRLQHVLEVDTRRKGFHFIMVIAFLPTIFVDPATVAAAFVAILAVFLLLDLLRASQLPPLSRPIAAFIAPYIDGRDLAGPVIVSPFFLLIGCAIPLWLTLAYLPRSSLSPQLPVGSGSRDSDPGRLRAWEVPTRDLSMVAGVVCVGLGDAAASLVGRRFGHHKWAWGGSKSLEGSLAFALAVCAGLAAARAWLAFGGWAVSPGSASTAALGRSAVCAVLSSMTEAVLTGANDNVIVPVVLWTCVRGLGI